MIKSQAIQALVKEFLKGIDTPSFNYNTITPDEKKQAVEDAHRILENKTFLSIIARLCAIYHEQMIDDENADVVCKKMLGLRDLKQELLNLKNLKK